MSTTTPRPTPETDSQCYDCEYRGHMGSVFTAEAGKSHPYGDHVSADFARKLERERDEMREELQQWKMLCAWGGTPEHIDQFIKGQQSRIHRAQDIEETCEQLERERNEACKHLAAANKGAEINAHINHSLAAKLAEAKRELNEARDQLNAMREAIREVFNSFADEDSAWLLDDLQTAALTKLQPFIKP